MPFRVILAHGGLGSWDELIFIGVVAVFIIMMGISWVRSRNMSPEFDDTPDDAPESAPDAPSDEHFELK